MCRRRRPSASPRPCEPDLHQPIPVRLLNAFLRRFGSVKLRLSITGVLLIALSVAVTVGLVLNEVAARAEQVALDLSLAQTRKLARIMGARVVSLQLTLRAASDTMPVDQIDNHAAIRQWLEGQKVLGSALDMLMVLDREGRVVALRDDKGSTSPPLNLSDRPYFRQTIQQGRPVVSEPLQNRLNDRPIVVLTMPVRDHKGQVVGVMGGTVKLLSNALMSEVTASDGDDEGRVVITDAQGRLLAHDDARWLMRDAQTDPLLAEGIAHWQAMGRPVEPAGFSLHAGNRIISMAGVPDADWMVMRSAPVDSVLSVLRAGGRRALVIGTLVALAGGLVLLLVTHFMLRPLRQLEQRAHRMRDGVTPDDEGWPRALGEIGQLSRALHETLRERSAAAAANRELLSKLTALMDHAPLGIAFSQERRLVLVNGALERMLGYSAQELQGQPSTVLSPSVADAASLAHRINACFRAGRPFDEEVRMVRRDGTQFWGRLFGAPVNWHDPKASTVWTVEDVSHARSQREALSWVSTHDALTELVNRREFERRLNERLARPEADACCALFIDLDHFKAVNDTAGHATGDRMLVEVARRLQAQVRTTDTVARLGGDEFAVLLTACSRSDALHIAEQMRTAIEDIRLPWHDQALQVGASFGIVKLSSDLPDLSAVMAAADAACYDAKRAGRNQVRLHANPGDLPTQPVPLNELLH